MTTGNTYYIDGDILVPSGDTLKIQSGVTVYITGNYIVFVQGVFLSLGTFYKPNWITVSGVAKSDNINSGQNPGNDPAYTGYWQGIICDVNCPLLSLKWTHVEFAGLPTSTSHGSLASGLLYTVYYGNTSGMFIMEDSWIYGCPNDAVRLMGGNVWIARNTFEKCGYQGGDCVNAKSTTTGDMCYNLFIGTATNGTKASDKGAPTGAVTECNINMYNNDYINGGYRNVTPGKGACIDYEQGAEGLAYNNLIVDCKVGLRILSSPVADTNNCHYGNQFYYIDDTLQGDQIYPTSGPSVTHPETTDIPLPSTYLPISYTLGSPYYAPGIVGKNNPDFVSYGLPNTNYSAIAYATGFDFHLQSTSPCIGKGYTGFKPLAKTATYIPVDSVHGASEITLPGKDAGCYQHNGSGNQHGASKLYGGITPSKLVYDGISIYPNPATDNLTIISNEMLTKAEYSIIDCFGKTLTKGRLSGEKTTISVSSLTPGMYFISVNSNEAGYAKFIKE